MVEDVRLRLAHLAGTFSLAAIVSSYITGSAQTAVAQAHLKNSRRHRRYKVFEASLDYA